MEEQTPLPEAPAPAQVEEQPTAVQPVQPTQPPTPQAMLQQALNQLGALTLGLAEQRQVLTERERNYRSLGAELDSRRVKIEIDEAACARLQGAAEALQMLVGGAE